MTTASEIDISLPSTTTLSAAGYKYGLRDHPAFCATCTNFNHDVALECLGVLEPGRVHLLDFWDAVLVNSTLEEIAEAAEGGCSSCLLLRQCLLAFCGRDVLANGEDLEISITYWEGKALTVALDHGGKYEKIELFCLEGSSCPWPTIGSDIWQADPQDQTWPLAGGVAAPVPVDPDSGHCYDTIRKWLQMCEQDHPWCDVRFPLPDRSLQTPAQAPKRLVYVGKSDVDVKLCDITGASPSYAVLSYCWGSQKGLLTQRHNLAALKSSIPTSELRGSRGDAIHVARRIGLQYIWIDSLCIVQDDQEDWAIESANMASIYANAYICISASSARGSDSGFLHDRDTTKTFRLTDVGGNSSTIFARKRLPHSLFGWSYQGSDLLPHSTPKDGFPLFKRGWTFQERLLSPRILHYTEHEMIWECLGSTSCECGAMAEHAVSPILRERRLLAAVRPNVEIYCDRLTRAQKLAERYGLRDKKGPPALRWLSNSIRNDVALIYAIYGTEGEFNIHKESLTERWHTLVQDYSERALTFQTDVLPALSGLASRWALRQPFDAEYFAGLWRHNFIEDLLWKCTGSNTIGRPDEYLAPTWSWASIRRPVEFLESAYDPIYHAYVDHVVCDISPTNPFGAVKSGYLQLRGPTIEGRLCPSQGGSAGFVQLETHKQTFCPDSIPECARLEAQMVLILWICTAVNDEGTRRGYERALVFFEKQDSIPRSYIRLGVVSFHEGDMEAIPWRERSIIVV